MYKPSNIVAAAGIALLSLATVPSIADEMKTGAMQSGTMSASPMSSNQMSSNQMQGGAMSAGTMSAGAMSASPKATDPMKADCLDKAGMETDAAKKEAAIAACGAIGGTMMQSGQTAPAQ